MNDPASTVLAILPEGPVAHDGAVYRYSKGERKYIDGLAAFFKEVVIVSFVFRKGDVYYDACSHSPFMAPNVRVVELPRGAGEPTVLGKVWQFCRVFAVILRTVPRTDLLYLFVPGYPSAMAWIVGRLCGRKHFVYAADDWVQATPGMFKWDHLRRSWLYRLFAWTNRVLERRIATTALFNVTAGKALLAKYHSFGRPVVETTPRMTLSPQDIYIRADTCGGRCVQLINVGSLNYDKAQHVLLEALVYLNAWRPGKLVLHLVGEGPLRAQLERLAEGLGISAQVVFHGHVQSEDDLYALYRGADIFVLSSVSEGFPRVLYEAMAMHLPIVTTNVGGIAQLMLDGRNARVVAAGDPKALAMAIESIINDGSLRRTLLRGGAETIRTVFEKMDPHQIPKLLTTIGAPASGV